MNLTNETRNRARTNLRNRIIISAIVIIANIISAIIAFHSAPTLRTINIFCVVVCLPVLIVAIIMFRDTYKDNIYFTELPFFGTVPAEISLKDPKSKYIFMVKNYTSGSDLYDPLNEKNIQPVEFQANRFNAEALLSFETSESAITAKDLLVANNLICSNIVSVQEDATSIGTLRY